MALHALPRAVVMLYWNSRLRASEIQLFHNGQSPESWISAEILPWISQVAAPQSKVVHVAG
jgi:hypothetical protein